jgi:hypothetical protein
MKAKGRKVPALDKKPELPNYLKIVMRAINDLAYEGSIRFPDYCMWCDRFGIHGAQFEYIWQVLKEAFSKVHEWEAMQRSSQSSQTNSGKTTGR